MDGKLEDNSRKSLNNEWSGSTGKSPSSQESKYSKWTIMVGTGPLDNKVKERSKN